MIAFDLRPIVNNFYSGIFNSDSRPNWEAYALLVIPAVLAQAAVFSPVTESKISTISTALAILFGFTFSSLLTTAKYSSKDDRLEQQVVQETRVGTSYALLVNLVSLFLVVGSSVFISNYSNLSYIVSTSLSALIYYSLFHYLLVMVYLMRYLYLLAIGGAFEEEINDQNDVDSEERKRAPQTR